jgi:hypothetical protein
MMNFGAISLDVLLDGAIAFRTFDVFGSDGSFSSPPTIDRAAKERNA